MKVYRSLSEIHLKQSVIAIGVFDGVHRGHQLVLAEARKTALSLDGLTSVALTFDRHPAELIAPRRAPDYLTSLSQRVEMIEKFALVDAVLVIPFDLQFANLPAFDFVKNVLVDRLGAKLIFVGADFRYGKDRSGGVMDLQAAGEIYGFKVVVIQSVAEQGARVSSTRIRSLVGSGDVGNAQRMLGHPFSIRGTVTRGKSLGRTIGYPTANVEPEQNHQLLPASGVYAAYIHLPMERSGRTTWPAAVSVGINPTTDSFLLPKIEAYIMDGFNADIYGERVDVDFIEKLREEEKFASLDALVEQIGKDVHHVESILLTNDCE